MNTIFVAFAKNSFMVSEFTLTSFKKTACGQIMKTVFTRLKMSTLVDMHLHHSSSNFTRYFGHLHFGQNESKNLNSGIFWQKFTFSQ